VLAEQTVRRQCLSFCFFFCPRRETCLEHLQRTSTTPWQRLAGSVRVRTHCCSPHAVLPPPQHNHLHSAPGDATGTTNPVRSLIVSINDVYAHTVMLSRTRSGKNFTMRPSTLLSVPTRYLPRTTHNDTHRHTSSFIITDERHKQDNRTTHRSFGVAEVKACTTDSVFTDGSPRPPIRAMSSNAALMSAYLRVLQNKSQR